MENDISLEKFKSEDSGLIALPNSAFDLSLSIKSHQPIFGLAGHARIGCSDFSDMAGPRGPGAERGMKTDLNFHT